MNTELSDKVKKTFGEKLRAAREAAEYHDAVEFAHALGVTPHRYRHWEAGRAKPDIVMVTRICQLLKVEPNDLLPFAVRKKKKADSPSSISSPSGGPAAA